MKLARWRILWVVMFSLGATLLSCGGNGGSNAEPPAYYVDSVSGDDANGGTTPSSPWQTLGRVSSTVQSGARVYLKRGSVWHEQLTVPSSGITIDAYGTGPLPTIDGSRQIAGWAETAPGSGLFSSPAVTLASGEALGNVTENGAMMSFLTWTTDAATTFAGAPRGTYSYEYGPSRIYVKPASSPSGNLYRASVKLYGIDATSTSDVLVRNVNVTRFSLHGIHFKDCVRCEVRDSTVSQGGGATIASGVYAGNGIEFGNDSSYGVVDGVAVSEIFDSGVSPQTYSDGRTMSAITIRNSQVSSCGFAGIEVSVLSNGGTAGSSISGVVISGVTVTGAGRGWSGRRYGTEGHGIRIKADDGAGTVSGILLDTTTVASSAGDGVVLGGEIGTVAMSRMDIKNNFHGINLSEPTATGATVRLTSSLVHHNVSYGILYDSPSAAGIVLYQDTFADNGGINLAILHQSGTTVIRNNLFDGSTAMTHLYAATALTGAVIDNNCYNNLTNMFGYNGMPYSTVTAFRSATGFETNGLGGGVGLTDPAAEDFTLMSTSQCKTLGSAAVAVPVDYSGYSFSDPPSSGAYQFR